MATQDQQGNFRLPGRQTNALFAPGGFRQKGGYILSRTQGTGKTCPMPFRKRRNHRDQTLANGNVLRRKHPSRRRIPPDADIDADARHRVQKERQLIDQCGLFVVFDEIAAALEGVRRDVFQAIRPRRCMAQVKVIERVKPICPSQIGAVHFSKHPWMIAAHVKHLRAGCVAIGENNQIVGCHRCPHQPPQGRLKP